MKNLFLNNWGKVIKDNDRYKLTDLEMGSFKFSLTQLRPYHGTGGHSHVGYNEVYLFLTPAVMQIEKEGEEPEFFQVDRMDLVVIPNGAFHRVLNPTENDCNFVSIFEDYDRDNPPSK